VVFLSLEEQFTSFMTDSSAPFHGSPHPDSQQEAQYFHDHRVYSLQLEINQSCPQGCLYCYASCRDPPEKELDIRVIRRLLKEAVGLGIPAIDWLGGDPLLRDGWEDLLEYAAGLGLVNNIWTSGIPLSDVNVARNAVRLTRGGFISVHLDSLDPALYRMLHAGRANENVEAILTGVENVLESGKNPGEMLNCITFTRPLAGKDVAETMLYFQERGIRTCLTQLSPAGSAMDHPEWIPTPLQIREACAARDRLNYPGSTIGSIGPMDVNKFYCRGIVCVTVDGDVTPCSVIRKGFGNIHSRSLGEILRDHRDPLLFLGLSTGDPDCRGCPDEQLCWGCRATAYYATGELLGKDPCCWRQSRER
jgi:MoaA/NifB/PqqE/SkfB family radical SAM enzyme